MKNILLGGLVTILFLIGNYIENHYTRNATVENATFESGNYIITVIDDCGYLWKYMDSEKLKKGTKVKLYMNTNCTDNIIYDDIIENAEII